MRWAIIRLICLRELRDQLRDRRTMFVMIVLPLLIYPLGGIGLMHIVGGVGPSTSVVGLVGSEHLPRGDSPRDYPPLLIRDGDRTRIAPRYLPSDEDSPPLVVELLNSPDREPLDRGRVDLILVVPPNFRALLENNQSPVITLLSRPDDRSKLALVRTFTVMGQWREALKQVRLARSGLPPGFDSPFALIDPALAGRPPRPQVEEIFDLLTKIFPFVLVLWSLAGALYPAVDLCAGEKERGTMETLLITPAQREEIVWGKFLTIWIFSAVTALLNLASMAVTSGAFSSKLVSGSLPVAAVAWSVLLLLPLSAFFSAICLSVGAYARSTKEGQYYLMPLFVIVMPLVFLTLVPGVELNPFYSMVPVTGVALLLQRLIHAGTPDPTLWLYFVPVLVPMVIYSWMALRWAIIQFQSEEVLFRDANRLEMRLWVKRLFRDREPRPSAGQAMFCFVMVLGLSWFSLGFGTELLATNLIRFLAFVAAPTLLMAFLLTSQPRQSLAIRVPPTWAWPVAIALVVVLTPPLVELTLFLLRVNPHFERLTVQYQPFPHWVRMVHQDGPGAGLLWWQVLVVFAILPAVCEELTFRGFILTGLQRRFRPSTAAIISSFLFCVMQMNVFQFVPTFILGVVLAYLTTRCGSILPSMLFHVLYRTLLILLAPVLFRPGQDGQLLLPGLTDAQRSLLVAACFPLAGLLLWWLTTLHPHPAYVAFLESDPGMEPPPSSPEIVLPR